jgi:hypothetical protein
MYQKSKPGPHSTHDQKMARPSSQLVSFRLYPEDLERLDALVSAGYAANRTEALRRSIAETARWTLPRT